MSKHDKKEFTYTFEQLTKLLLKDNNINEGHYLTLVLPDISGGQIKSQADENSTQGLIVEFNNIKLVEVDAETENAVDASQI